MGKDFWLYYLAKQLDFCVMNRTQKAKVLDLLLDAFHVENPMDAMSHFTYMNTNDSYYQYMNHCFGIADPDCAVFWILFSSMAGNDGERLSMTMGFIRSHMRFMMQLERYLQIMFPEWGFGQNMKNYMIRLNKYVLAALDGDRHAAANPDYLVNPIYPCM
ncbi:MAG: hypothetical protein IJ468_12405 [Lachnospiraceae bacterium]|nr:hypothetical protein [Lachnospiraceae bacterium]